MKNKKVKIWGFLFSLLILVVPFISVDAATQTVSLSGDTSISPGSTVTYSIILNNSDTATITAFTGTISFDSSVLSLTDITAGSGFSGTSGSASSGTDLNFTSTTGGVSSTKITVATLTFKVTSNASVSSATIKISGPMITISETDSETSVVSTQNESLSAVSQTLKIKSSDNTLSSIKVNGTEVDSFASSTYEYDITVDSSTSSAKIVASTTSSKASLKSGYGNRTVSLNYGSNVVQIIVVSESGVEQTYNLTITREDTRSDDTTLSSITVDGEEIDNFSSSTYSYTIKKYKMESVEIVGIPTDSNATVKVTKPKSIIVGNNTYTITVTSENGETADYTVIINNIEDSISKMLKTLSIKGYDIDFDKNNNYYEIMYSKSKFENLHIYYTTVGDSDEVEAVLEPDINNDSEALENLSVGDEITITVTGIDGESSIYTIKIIKDSRISFFLVVEVLLIIIIVIIIIVLARKRKKKIVKKNDKGSKNNIDNKKKEKESSEKQQPKRRIEDEPAVEIVEKPKKKRFSIFEDEYEEVEIEVEDDATKEFDRTKELTDDELNLK